VRQVLPKTSNKKTSIKTKNSKSKNNVVPTNNQVESTSSALDYADFSSAISKLVLRDLTQQKRNPTFYKYTRDQIANYIKDPARNEKQLRDAIIYIYNASSNFRRIIQYFVGLTNWQYIIYPDKLDTTTAKPETIKKQFQKTINLISTIDIKSQFPNILTVCLREDTFYGTIWHWNDTITIQQLPSDYCTISSIQQNVPNVSFDFSYFDTYSDYLPLYPAEFQTKYNLYRSNTTLYRWQELDAPNSFAVKVNSDILAYSVPPFAGILEDLYNLIDYKSLQMTRTELENYALLVLKLGKDKDGAWDMPFEKAVEFWQRIDSELPRFTASAMSPMEIQKITFDKANTTGDDKVAQAQNALFAATGISSQIFNADSASSNALLQSIKADQAFTFEIVKKIEAVVNRFLMNQSFSKNFRVKFLDVSRYNEKDVAEQYYKAVTVGAPAISLYCASIGIGQNELNGLNFLENDVLNLPEKFIPLQTSHTQSNKGGRPQKEADELTDSGESTREGEKNDF